MKCLRCGYCCINFFVPIVKNPELGIIKGNLIVHEGKGPCIHLKGNKIGEYFCSIHNKKWYKDTPCFQYDQIGKENAECRTGRHMLDRVIHDKQT